MLMQKVIGYRQWQKHGNVCRYMESAEVYAQTQNSFEEVTLKFIRLEEKDALKAFLLKKLAGLKAQVSKWIEMF